MMSRWFVEAENSGCQVPFMPYNGKDSVPKKVFTRVDEEVACTVAMKNATARSSTQERLKRKRKRNDY